MSNIHRPKQPRIQTSTEKKSKNHSHAKYERGTRQWVVQTPGIAASAAAGVAFDAKPLMIDA